MSASLKLSRARRHAAELRDCLSRYMVPDPFEVVVEKRPSEIAYVLRIHRPPPPEFALTAGDAIQNARTALDHVACALVANFTGTPAARLRDVDFPIQKQGRRYRQSVKKLGKRITPQAQTVFDEIQAHKSGNLDLWRLNELNNYDKHRTLLTPVASSQAFTANLGLESMQNLEPGEVIRAPSFRGRTGPHKNGDVILTLSGDMPFEFPPDFHLVVGLYEPDIDRCEAIDVVVARMIEVAAETVAKFEDLL